MSQNLTIYSPASKLLSMVRKIMIGNNPRLDLVNVDVHTKFGLIIARCFCEKSKLGLNVDAHTKFVQILSIHSFTVLSGNEILT